MKIKFGYEIPYSSIDEIIDKGLRAEEYGFDSVWIPDHLLSTRVSAECPETWILLTAIGLKTGRIMLGSGVTDPFRKHPATIAQTVATLDKLTGGRAILGIGAGEEMNLIPYGIPWDQPIRKLRESVILIKSLWTATMERPANYKGKHFTLRDAFLVLKPEQSPHPPIYIGALGRKTRELTGELADGWYPLVVTPEHYEKQLHDIRIGATKAGREIGEIDTAARILFATSSDYERNRARIISGIKFMLMIERNTLRLLGYDLDLPEELSIQKIIPGKQEQKTREYLDKIPNEAVDVVVAKSKSDCTEEIHQFIRNGAKHIILQNLGGDETVEDFKDIIKYFKTC